MIAIIYRDGVEVARIDALDVLAWFHKQHSFSMDWACRHEGYKVSYEESDK